MKIVCKSAIFSKFSVLSMSALKEGLERLEAQHQETIGMIEKRHQEMIDAINREMRRLRQEIDDDYIIKKEELLKLILPNNVATKQHQKVCAYLINFRVGFNNRQKRKRNENESPADCRLNHPPYKKCKSDSELIADQAVKYKSKATYILITKGKYDDDFKMTETGACLIWSGQAKRTTHDATVVCGTHVFIRDKGSTPYIHQGIVAQKEVIRPRTKILPIKLKLMIDVAVQNAGRLCDDIIDTDHFKYQNGCWRTLSLPKFKANGHGIYKV